MKKRKVIPEKKTPKVKINTLYEIFDLFYLRENKLLKKEEVPGQFSPFIIGKKKYGVNKWDSANALLPKEIWDCHKPMYDKSVTNKFIKDKLCPQQFSEKLVLLLQAKPRLIYKIAEKSNTLYSKRINQDNALIALSDYSKRIRDNNALSKIAQDDIIEYIDNDIHKLVSVMAVFGLVETTPDFISVWEKFRGKSFASAKKPTDENSSTFAEQQGNNSISPKPNNENADIVFFTAVDLDKYKLSAEDAAKQLIKNDQRLYGFACNDINAGTTDQLKSHIELFPHNWGFLWHLPSQKIIGNFSFCFLDVELSELLQHGKLTGNQVTSQAVANPIGAEELSLYLMNISVNAEFDSLEHWETLFNEFAKSLAYWIKRGVFLNYILLAVFKESFCSIYRNYGFRRITKRTGSGYQEIWGISLFNGFPRKFSPALVDMKWELNFRQLSYDDYNNGLITEQHLTDISRLIFDTDPFIYPCMFTRQNAIGILPRVFIGNKDNMFKLDNCYVAFLGERIVGLILHHQGPFVWNDQSFDRIWHLYNPGDNDTTMLQAVKSQYFSVYSEESLVIQDENNKNALLLLNFSIHKSLRFDKSYGNRFLEEFLKDKTGRIYLRAIKDVTHDLDVYIHESFEIVHQTTGFSLNDPKPDCVVMVRDIEK